MNSTMNTGHAPYHLVFDAPKHLCDTLVEQLEPLLMDQEHITIAITQRCGPQVALPSTFEKVTGRAAMRSVSVVVSEFRLHTLVQALAAHPQLKGLAWTAHPLPLGGTL